jgi:hypothetical protein
MIQGTPEESWNIAGELKLIPSFDCTIINAFCQGKLLWQMAVVVLMNKNM